MKLQSRNLVEEAVWVPTNRSYTVGFILAPGGHTILKPYDTAVFYSVYGSLLFLRPHRNTTGNTGLTNSLVDWLCMWLGVNGVLKISINTEEDV
jgi:hypothetical protein